MAAGLSRRQRYDRTRRLLIRVEKLALALPEVKGTLRDGGKYLLIYASNIRKVYVQVYVQVQWMNLSNGESWGLLTLNGKHEWGDITDRIREALAK